MSEAIALLFGAGTLIMTALVMWGLCRIVNLLGEVKTDLRIQRETLIEVSNDLRRVDQIVGRLQMILVGRTMQSNAALAKEAGK